MITVDGGSLCATELTGDRGALDVRFAGPSAAPVAPGWFAVGPPVSSPTSGSDRAGLVVLPAVRQDGLPGWLFVVQGPIGGALRRRLRTEVPALTETVRAVLAEPQGGNLLPWIDLGDPKAEQPYLAGARPGPTFADDLKRGPLPVAAVVHACLICGDLLRSLHRLRRPHGQISPATLHHDGDAVRVSAPLPPALGELVALAGGTGHEAPEILRGGELNAPADVFSLASTAWTLLAGRPPFGRTDDPLARLTALEPPAMRRAEVPSALASALRAALSPDPGRRPDLATLEQALRIVVSGPAQAVPPRSGEPRFGDQGAREDTLAPTRPVDDTGQPLGSRYLLDELIGRGATGHVWRGHIRGTSSRVAVKLLRSEFAEDPDVVTRFMRERSTLLRLQHPNLVAVQDLVAEGNALAIVMDLVDGEDLRAVLRTGTLSPADAAVILAQTASALAFVHAESIVHRDLKPENVMIARGPGIHARLTDFGLARAVEPSLLTRASQLVGTPAYIAPELVAGRTAGPAADVYAFGVTAYEVLGGRRPFAAPSAAALLRAQLDENPTRPEGMSDDAWTVVSACLLKDPDARPTAPALAVAWWRIAKGEPLTTRTAPPVPRPAVAVPAAAVPAAAVPAPVAYPSSGYAPPTGSPLPGSSAGLLWTTGAQDTTAARRPLAPRHVDPPKQHRATRRWWVLGCVAVLVLAFGIGIAFAVLHHKPAAAANSSAGYPLHSSLTVSHGITTVRWTVPSGVPGASSVIVVSHSGKNGKPIGPPFDPAARSGKLPDIRPGECVVVYLYEPAKPPPSGSVATQTCRPKPTATTPTKQRTHR